MPHNVKVELPPHPMIGVKRAAPHLDTPSHQWDVQSNSLLLNQSIGSPSASAKRQRLDSKRDGGSEKDEDDTIGNVKTEMPILH